MPSQALQGQQIGAQGQEEVTPSYLSLEQELRLYSNSPSEAIDGQANPGKPQRTPEQDRGCYGQPTPHHLPTFLSVPILPRHPDPGSPRLGWGGENPAKP